MASISVENVSFSYGKEDVLSSVSFHASGNEKIAILGSNGSGKSTLMKLLDGLLPLKRGDIKIDGRSVKDENIRAIRRKIGIVFQDPDSQFVSPVLEEDTAFGPENYNLSDIPSLVRNSLTLTGLYEARKRVPQTLSGGEKERAQLAGIVAVSPEIVILDESFSMLDECGKNEMKALVESICSARFLFPCPMHVAARGAPPFPIRDENADMIRITEYVSPTPVNVSAPLSAICPRNTLSTRLYIPLTI